jgi:hypothetical protein
MKRRSPFASTAASALALLVVACSDNSTGLRSTFYAQHFDSLYSAEVANHSGIETNRSLVLNDIEIATAFGAVPAVIPVKTATGIETWRGVEYIADAKAPASRFYHDLVVYRETDAHTVLEVYFDSAGSAYFATLLFDDSALTGLPDVTGQSVLTSQHMGCPSPPTLSNPGIATYALAQCTTAQFTDSITINFPESPVFDSSLRHLEFGPFKVPGVVFDPGFGDRATTPLPRPSASSRRFSASHATPRYGSDKTHAPLVSAFASWHSQHGVLGVTDAQVITRVRPYTHHPLRSTKAQSRALPSAQTLAGSTYEA